MSSSEELQACFAFFRGIDINGRCTSEVSPRKLTSCYYFNNENINITKLHEYLNHLAINFRLSRTGCKLPFKLKLCKVEH